MKRDERAEARPSLTPRVAMRSPPITGRSRGYVGSAYRRAKQPADRPGRFRQRSRYFTRGAADNEATDGRGNRISFITPAGCIAAGLLAASLAAPGGAARAEQPTSAFPTGTSARASPSSTPPLVVLRPIGKNKPSPRTARTAVARVRAAPDTSREASPFKRELAWAAQWRRDRWWLVGLFESPWGTRFVVDATLSRGKVYTYIAYADRPAAAWVHATAGRFWHVPTLYTRLTPDAAISLVRPTTISSVRYTVLDAAAKLARDTAREVGWYFVFYVQDQSGQRLVLVVSRYGGEPVEEGLYTGGYGFGSQPEVQTGIPLNLSDWVRSVVRARGWTPSNAP
jgi:hypothetical protein